MKIEYFVINAYDRHVWGNDELKFSSVEKIKKYILENYKFEPNLHIPNHKFTGLRIEQSFVLDKTGQKFVDYSNYDFSRYEFEKCNFKRDGYYELSYEVQPVKETDVEITFSAQIFITFVTAQKEFTPEIKTPGVPYQESKTVIKETGRSIKYPLRVCKDKYGIALQLDNWYKTENCFVYSTIGWTKEVLEILD